MFLWNYKKNFIKLKVVIDIILLLILGKVIYLCDLGNYKKSIVL